MQSKVIQLRKKCSISQTVVAKELNIALKSYWRKEKGITEFTESEIKKLMELLDARFEELF